MSSDVDGVFTSEDVKRRISARKKGVPQTPAHLEARKEGRKPKFAIGDSVIWFEDEGVIEKLLGASSVYDNGLRAIWYTVRFGGRTRDLNQEVLRKAETMKCKVCEATVGTSLQPGSEKGFSGCCSKECAQAAHVGGAMVHLSDTLERFFPLVDVMAGRALR